MIAVTGASGGVGSRVAKRLAAAGTASRLLVRDPEKLADAGIGASHPGGAAVIGGYDDVEGLRKALDGIDTLFLIPAHETPDRVDLHRNVIEVASDIGVSHIVYLSFLRPDGLESPSFTLMRDHWDTEDILTESGLVTTFLRMTLYMDFLPLMVGEDGAIRGPAGEGRFAPICRDDIADSAAAVLGDPDAHAGAVYNLTGPELLNFEDIAAALTIHGDRKVEYVDETIEEAYRSREKFNAPDWQVEAWVGTYLSIARGELEFVGDGVPTLTRQPATTLATFLRQQT